MQKTCRNSWCKATFEITDEDLKFYEQVSPVFGGRKYMIPPPSLCPDCRQQRRLLWRNERSLYRRTCDLCKKSIVSMYPQRSTFPIYCSECWWSDRWDPRDFGREVDFTRPFLAQMEELQHVVPRLALNVVNNENSEFINHSGSNKNCYLIFAAEFNEDCLYGYQVIKSTGCTDTFDCTESHYCYDVIDVDKCHLLFFSQNCTNCSSSAFLFDCKGCSECLLSTNLRNKRYYIRNREYSEEEYRRIKQDIMEKLAQGKLEDLLQEFAQVKEQAAHRAREVVSCENVTGDYLKNSRNLRYCFDVSYGEDCAYIFTGFQIKDLMDVCHTTDAQLGYDSLSLGYGSYNTIFTHSSWGSSNLLYCDLIQSGSNMCGCVCMKPAKYCILNKEYSQEEYEALVPKVIELMQKTGEWGEFFPAGFSPFAYNETTAQMYFPLTAAEARERGFPWRDGQDEVLNVTKTIPAKKLPPAIADIPNDVLNWAVTSEFSGRPFRIVKRELEFYRSHRLPVPHAHPDERHFRRMAQKNPRKLWSRTCSTCGKEMQTTYRSDRPEIVFCEECYLKEVY
ncbi:hypothetical protein COU80_02690 [Candidatus Peregrinibacteria bacterium CG10_big_fil_rev_8_21_14_0_10_55_24]|nr:MAG: hypothetical protein COU80_02690 [Candidatus Peregrinibacteria bacterium CG10_big_fil_rev_8_21_14_0_10_55_24]